MEDYNQSTQIHSTTKKKHADVNGNLNIRMLLTNRLSSNAENSTERTNRSSSRTRWYIPHIHEDVSYSKSPSLDHSQTLICMVTHLTRYVLPYPIIYLDKPTYDHDNCCTNTDRHTICIVDIPYIHRHKSQTRCLSCVYMLFIISVTLDLTLVELTLDRVQIRSLLLERIVTRTQRIVYFLS